MLATAVNTTEKDLREGSWKPVRWKYMMFVVIPKMVLLRKLALEQINEIGEICVGSPCSSIVRIFPRNRNFKRAGRGILHLAS